jgi:hypothetical protein
MDVRANSGAFYAPFLFAPTIAPPQRHRIGRIPPHSMRANPGAFYAPFLFAPTIAALRPHHIGRIPAHSMRAWTYGRIPAHSVRAWTYGRIVAHSMRRFYSPLRLPRHDRITSGESRRIPCAHGLDVRANPGAHRAPLDWTYGRITGAFRARMDVGANSGAFYAPFLFAPTVAAPRPHRIGRIPAHSVRANPGAFLAPFLFAPTVAAPRPHRPIPPRIRDRHSVPWHPRY